MEKIDGKSIREGALAGGTSAEQAFERFYRYFYRRLVVYASTFRSLPATEREDLSHDIIIRSFSRLHIFESERSLSSWVYGIARNYLIDTLRARKIATVSANEETLTGNGSPDSGFEAEFERNELLSRIMKEILGMGDTDRRIAMLVFYDELSTVEASRALGIPAGTLRWRLMHIRKRLRKIRGEEL